MSEYVYIYLLHHPFLNEGYIGVSNNLHRRYREHLRDRNVTPKSDWILEMKNGRLKPKMEVLERVLKNKSFAREKEITREYLLKGWAIMNSTNRGIGGKYERITEWRTLNDL